VHAAQDLELLAVFLGDAVEVGLELGTALAVRRAAFFVATAFFLVVTDFSTGAASLVATAFFVPAAFLGATAFLAGFCLLGRLVDRGGRLVATDASPDGGEGEVIGAAIPPASVIPPLPTFSANRLRTL